MDSLQEDFSAWALTLHPDDRGLRLTSDFKVSNQASATEPPIPLYYFFLSRKSLALLPTKLFVWNICL